MSEYFAVIFPLDSWLIRNWNDIEHWKDSERPTTLSLAWVKSCYVLCFVQWYSGNWKSLDLTVDTNIEKTWLMLKLTLPPFSKSLESQQRTDVSVHISILYSDAKRNNRPNEWTSWRIKLYLDLIHRKDTERR